ncbi:MAG: beta-ketoacyl-[acyl-carrier-protein] synthase family protein [Bryobacteraceae bacterium]
MMRRVAVTGIGVISPLGHTRDSFWNAVSNGISGIAPIRAVDCNQLRAPNGAEVKDYAPLAHFEPKIADQIDRFAQFSLIAAREAVKQAGVSLAGARSAIVTGSAVGGKDTEDRAFEQLYRQGNPRVPPLTIPRIMANAGASFLAMEFGVTGPVYNLSTACASSNHAIGQAFWMVRSGQVDLALTGGSEAIFSMGILKAWEAMRVLAPDTCRPFSRDRKGLVLGEGGAMLVLEPLDAALARGATVFAEIAGFGMTADAHHVTQPSVEGPAAAIQAALGDAGLTPEQVGYVNAHGTGTAANDATETKAIRRVFGSAVERVAISSTKSMHGHALGAAGALEAAATALALHTGVLPPTANYNEPDPDCDLDVIPNQSRTLQVEAALSNAFAFGGLNAVLAFRRFAQRS